jgi:uncharacterized membrane protein YozB (DUF420 family)
LFTSFPKTVAAAVLLLAVLLLAEALKKSLKRRKRKKKWTLEVVWICSAETPMLVVATIKQ